MECLHPKFGKDQSCSKFNKKKEKEKEKKKETKKAGLHIFFGKSKFGPFLECVLIVLDRVFFLYNSWKIIIVKIFIAVESDFVDRTKKKEFHEGEILTPPTVHSLHNSGLYFLQNGGFICIVHVTIRASKLIEAKGFGLKY